MWRRLCFDNLQCVLYRSFLGEGADFGAAYGGNANNRSDSRKRPVDKAMIENLTSIIPISNSALVVLAVLCALLFGTSIGWLIWGAGRDDKSGGVLSDEKSDDLTETLEQVDGSPVADKPAEDPTSGPDENAQKPSAPVELKVFRRKLEGVEMELASVKSIIADLEEETEDVTDQISLLGEAVSQANDRLKVTIKTAKKLRRR